MKALALAPVLALAAFTLAAPPLAEAAHRHGRNCGHGGYYSRDHRPVVRHHRHDRHCRSGCNRGYSSRYYGARGYRNYYDPVPYYDAGDYGSRYYGSGYYGYVPPPPPPPRIYRQRRHHHRPRVGIFFGF